MKNYKGTKGPTEKRYNNSKKLFLEPKMAKKLQKHIYKKKLYFTK